MQWLLIVKLVVLLMVANGAPVIAAKLFGKFLNQALDRNAAFVDGRPIFGPSKTLRGIVLSLAATTAFAPILGFEWTDGLVIASAAMIGDLSSTFLKRRLNLPPSSRATGIDQIPECLLPAVAIRSTLGLTALDVVSIVIIFFVGELTGATRSTQAMERNFRGQLNLTGTIEEPAPTDV